MIIKKQQQKKTTQTINVIKINTKLKMHLLPHFYYNFPHYI